MPAARPDRCEARENENATDAGSGIAVRDTNPLPEFSPEVAITLKNPGSI